MRLHSAICLLVFLVLSSVTSSSQQLIDRQRAIDAINALPTVTPPPGCTPPAVCTVPTPGCTFTLSVAVATVPATASTGTVILTTQPTCAWVATPAVTWLLVSPPSGSGSATLTYQVQENTLSSTRSGELIIGAVAFTVNQAAAGTPPAPGGQLGEAGTWYVVDHFTANRFNGDGDPLWDETVVNQTVDYPPPQFTITGGSDPDGASQEDGGIYWHFKPKNGGYSFGAGAYLQHYVLDPAAASINWATVNRMRFLFRPNVSKTRDSSGGDTIQIGTYIRGHNNSDPGWAGAHYYHQIDTSFFANRWHLLIINRKTQHQVGEPGSTEQPIDPEWNGSSGVHYFDGMTRFYFDTIAGNAFNGRTFDFRKVDVGIVSGAPDTDIASIVAVYSGTRYEVVWASLVNRNVTYEVRYSTAGSMKAGGFTSGTSGGTTNSTGNTYSGVHWASPAMPEATPGIWIAMRVQGAASFVELYLPFNMGQ